ncbi:DUF4198 domain-containing protein [Helicobacter sp. 13S00477-4]|uniref:DUF4198 domain-containing protein n=1 Tax=Helicobacter sp. 13S00477-4 TaxID=1905759 RepID=UPI000BA54092|nr:DUF4198 domain-containing protein [Helicobacter sp. 13S00477-4]PAF51270.1 hypothetical protein BKH44_06070 [Helicobacter sp. 13S00477-4]
MKKNLLLVSLIMIFSALLNAHGIWTAMRSDEIQIVYGEGPWDNQFDAQTLQYVKGYDKNQKEKKVKIQPHDSNVALIPDDSVEILAAYAMSYWSEDGDGKWVKKPKNEVPNAKKSMLAKQYNIGYINQKKMLKKANEMILIKKPKANKDIQLEILPTVDPRGLKQGDELKVQVIKDGKPFPDAIVVPDVVGDASVQIKTDKNGFATFKIRNAGLNVVATWSIDPAKNTTKSDKDTIFSTLSFTLFKKDK